MLPYVTSFVIGYFIGSFPAAYVLVRLRTRTDIRHAGSGNVGAMNAFEVTNSHALGTTVFVVDAIKGVAAVVVCMVLWGREFNSMSLAGVGAIIGHNYPLWLKFKGGRGLSTTGGVMLVMGWLFVVVWGTLWAAIYLASKRIYVSNIAASVVCPLFIVLMPDGIVMKTLPSYTGNREFGYLVIVVCCLILVRHIEPMKDLLRSLMKQPS